MGRLSSSDIGPYVVSQSPGCMIFPWNSLRPGISGHNMSLSCPRAVTRTFAASSNISPVERFWTLIFLETH